MSKGYYLEWGECQWHSVGVMFFYGNGSNGSCPDILNNFILLQLQDLFNTQFDNGSFQCLWWIQDGSLTHRLLAVRKRLPGFFLRTI